MNKNWKKLTEKSKKVGWRTVTRKTFLMPDGSRADYDTYGPENNRYYAQTVAVTLDNKILVVGQYRPGPERYFWDPPAGQLDPGEDPEVGAAREMLEETGYKAEDYIRLGEVYQSAYLDNIGIIFLATKCKKVAEPQHEKDEFIEIKEISIEEFLNNTKTGKAIDVQAVYLAQDRLKELLGKDKS